MALLALVGILAALMASDLLSIIVVGLVGWVLFHLAKGLSEG